jgi:hypothetical protein
MRVGPALRAGLAALTALTLASCARDDPTVTLPEGEETETTAPEPTTGAASNACPVDGCNVSFQSIDDAGDEIKLTFTSNYAPEVSGNHYHVYWDRFEAKQVSNDAETKHGVTQGEWEPTADNPFTTTGAVAVAQRGESTMICVTPGDKDHNVIDPAVVECRDVANLL